MPLYFFDLEEPAGSFPDREGLVCDHDDEACREACRAAGEVASEIFARDRRGVVTVTIRTEAGRIVAQAKVHYACEIIETH